MKRALVYIVILFLYGLILTEGRAAVSKDVLVVEVEGVINPVTSEFIVKSIDEAERRDYQAVVIQLDTPGGLDTSMREIIKAINKSSVPVVVYVAPSGARAASAGVFITMAAHIAAMAPGTNIGAAHPVGLGGKMDKTMVEKATNDAVAYIRSIAEARGRNQDWAEKAVRKSVSITAKEALKLNVIDILAKDIAELLEKIDGRKVVTAAGTKTLKTKEARVVRKTMGMRFRILKAISDPNVAYILMLLGFYGLFFELTNPGAVFPGVVGAICLILAFYAFQSLPVNYAGVLLILLGIVLFILEVKITSHGALTIGGIVSMLIGSLMLFESPGPFMKLSLALVVPAVIVTALFFSLTLTLAYKAWKRKPVTGTEGLIGLEGIAHTDVFKDGMVLVRGEYWQAYSDEPIKKGERVVVESVSGLRIKVKKKEVPG
ncbi:MAG: nodulation protein NfeD [Nitrospirae bacterium]|nr:MAG: nodulation protein NfeD [Nitrospirota bacterium]